MKKTGIGCRFLCLIFAFLFFTIPVGAVGSDNIDLSVTQGCHTIDAQIPMISASEEITNLYAAVVYDYTNDTLIYAVDPDQRYDPASLVKIMTALIIAKQGNLDDMVTVDGSLLESLPEGSLGIQLLDGEVISLRDLLFSILVESANDAAIVAANYIYGSTDDFLIEMNRYAAELGCTNTTFTNVHGLYSENQVSTARDLARILTEAAKNEAFMEAFSTSHYTVPATNLSEPRELSSLCFIMNEDSRYYDSRVTGGRTGIMETGERNLAVTAQRDDVKLVSVVLGSISDLAADGYSVDRFGSYAETSALLSLGYNGHRNVQLFHKDQALKQFEVINGDSYVSTGVTDAVQVLLPDGVTYNDLIYMYDDSVAQLQAPVTAGDFVTTVQVWHKNTCLVQANLYALHNVKVREVIETQDTAADSTSGARSILPVIGIIVFLFVVFLFSRRFIFRMIRRHQIRRHKKNPRRRR